MELTAGWNAELDRGPDWLFVRLSVTDPGNAAESNLAESLWQLMQRQFAYRLILELDGLPMMRSVLIGQLVLLHKRVDANGGLLRLCGLSDDNQAVIDATRLGSLFPQYRSREDAVMGYRPQKPR